jgi:hypothetical protein
LAQERSVDIKLALLDQFIPLLQHIQEKCVDPRGYQAGVTTIFPLLDGLLYDEDEEIRDRAIRVLTDIREIVQQKENDYIMNLTLKLAHDDDEQNRVSALKIMNELAPDMG